MQPFSIDYITGHAGSSFATSQYTLQKRNSYEDDQSQNHLYYTTPLLDDVYSIINKDDALSSINPPSTSPLEMNCREQSTEALERGTPSPNRDSGIESDNSPVVTQTLRALDKKADAVKEKVSSSALTDKPPHSYIALIAMAILSSRDRKLPLADIYKHIIKNHRYYNNEEKSWRNSIRYNLSINECFIKCGKEESGKGHFWGIHPQCTDDFVKGDYRRRHARRRATRGMKIAGSEPFSNILPSRNIVYTPMTPSFAAYHPYRPSGVEQSNQSAYGRYHASEMTHAYTGQQLMTMPVGHYATPTVYCNPSHSNSYSHQPASFPGYTAGPSFGYMPPCRNTGNHPEADGKDTDKLGFETSEQKWYMPSTEQATQSVSSGDDEAPRYCIR